MQAYNIVSCFHSYMKETEIRMDKIIRIVFVVAFYIFATINSVHSFAKKCEDSSQYATNCKKWALYGECTKSYGFMKEFCKKSCNECPNISKTFFNYDCICRSALFPNLKRYLLSTPLFPHKGLLRLALVDRDQWD